ncbi:RNA polymerase sigma-70 factor, ECF subfamily [Amycolatopsis xylanica]|uniref:RNA polymerase sigma-70 factor, ECF subfamily n=1 Tax=Amycolatopsis xylanica TaxID=589385 RepID=A0A1H3T9L0_9PSEU|nr:RNA polymerase sigma factor SigJ [Amycolatopsis xylanica]SDZ46637.1 RNA polymerase sigma-70 factor, ECF subfamily [Amycolatopsis xylanica]
MTPDDPPSNSLDTATAVYAEHRELLFSLVYNLLGTVADTEDVLQETWLSWAFARHAQIANARAYLVRIAVNEALSRLRQARRARESYVGPWLPEPVVTETGPEITERQERTESVSLALMVVLETLTPLERAVFVLREAFGYDHTEIAAILGRTPAAVRQLSHRARDHVQARRPRFEPDPAVRRAATERFVAAALGGDLNTLMEVLAPDVTLWTDGGGKLRAALHAVEGREKVVRLIAATAGGRPQDLTIRLLDVNGGPAALMFAGDTVYGVVVCDLTPEDRIRAIYSVINPDKLTGVTARPGLDGR